MQPNLSGVNMLMPLIFMLVVFYFLIIRPQQKKQKEHQEMVKNLKKNDEIVTSSGIHGTIVQVKDTTLGVRIDDNAKMEIEKSSVAYVKKTRP